MLTPAMRAMFLLALPLLVSRVLTDHEDPAVPTDDLALLAHRLDRGSYLHDPFRASSLMIRTGRLWRPVRSPLPSPGAGLLHADGPLDLSATGEYSAVFWPPVSPISTPGSARAGTPRRAGSRPRWRSPRRRRTRGGAARTRA